MEKTDFQMLLDLKDFEPKQKGILDGEEVARIERALCINERESVLSLRNLRNFVVCYYGRLADKHDHNYDVDSMQMVMDIISGITSVIDNRIFALGGEV